MMLLGWVFVGLVGAGATYLSVTTDNDHTAIITGLVGTFTWALFAFLSLEVVFIDQSGTTHTLRYPALAAWGLLMAMPNLFVALTGPLEMVRDRRELGEEAA